MPRSRYEFIKIELRLLEDPAFFTLNEFDQLNYIKLITLAKRTKNCIKKNYDVIRQSFRSNRTTREIQESIKRITISFRERDKRGQRDKDTICQNKFNLWFRNWDERYTYGGVEEEKEKEKDKDKEKELICSLLKDWNERQTSPIANFKPQNIVSKYGEDKIMGLYKKYGKENNGFSQFLGHLKEVLL